MSGQSPASSSGGDKPTLRRSSLLKRLDTLTDSEYAEDGNESNEAEEQDTLSPLRTGSDKSACQKTFQMRALYSGIRRSLQGGTATGQEQTDGKQLKKVGAFLRKSYKAVALTVEFADAMSMLDRKRKLVSKLAADVRRLMSTADWEAFQGIVLAYGEVAFEAQEEFQSAKDDLAEIGSCFLQMSTLIRRQRLAKAIFEDYIMKLKEGLQSDEQLDVPATKKFCLDVEEFANVCTQELQQLHFAVLSIAALEEDEMTKQPLERWNETLRSVLEAFAAEDGAPLLPNIQSIATRLEKKACSALETKLPVEYIEHMVSLRASETRGLAVKGTLHEELSENGLYGDDVRITDELLQTAATPACVQAAIECLGHDFKQLLADARILAAELVRKSEVPISSAAAVWEDALQNFEHLSESEPASPHARGEAEDASPSGSSGFGAAADAASSTASSNFAGSVKQQTQSTESLKSILGERLAAIGRSGHLHTADRSPASQGEPLSPFDRPEVSALLRSTLGLSPAENVEEKPTPRKSRELVEAFSLEDLSEELSSKQTETSPRSTRPRKTVRIDTDLNKEHFFKVEEIAPAFVDDRDSDDEAGDVDEFYELPATVVEKTLPPLRVRTGSCLCRRQLRGSVGRSFLGGLLRPLSNGRSSLKVSSALPRQSHFAISRKSQLSYNGSRVSTKHTDNRPRRGLTQVSIIDDVEEAAGTRATSSPDLTPKQIAVSIKLQALWRGYGVRKLIKPQLEKRRMERKQDEAAKAARLARGPSEVVIRPSRVLYRAEEAEDVEDDLAREWKNVRALRQRCAGRSKACMQSAGDLDEKVVKPLPSLAEAQAALLGFSYDSQRRYLGSAQSSRPGTGATAASRPGTSGSARKQPAFSAFLIEEKVSPTAARLFRRCVKPAGHVPEAPRGAKRSSQFALWTQLRTGDLY
eukprot:TRINITY_DN20018_c0_g1_i1.p1 TRINITY_DN20018_c0_g1~~TRINITY_DN20018_c0_g1_i1.p1  ORF type:complete len:928 (+),score=207.41 TRINITY_DN20018_c0_g1_i1:105-2888(+)